MNKTCPKCGADYNGRPAPNQHDYWCGSTTWGEGDFYQSPECVRRERDQLLERIKRLESVVNDPHALWANWLRGAVKLPEGIGDVRQYKERIKLMKEALSVVVVSCEHLHHSKNHQHQLGEPCPVVELLKQAKEAKP